ncbi:MAG: 30S ribosomal protein S8e [Candidatus Marsarchaeota archaeon]|jgi:small subunit ribosomal protein S8e|nr:30S ribosomal protein S8e [Candidatus Marsarchaeota archaeon]
MSQFGSQLHGKSGRKLYGNGKIKKKSRDKKRFEMGGYFATTRLGEKNEVKKVRGRGRNFRNKMKYAAFANVLTRDGFKKAKIRAIVESPDNRNFARLNIMTKGCVIETELGKAVITSRPGKDGNINARLLG